MNLDTVLPLNLKKKIQERHNLKLIFSKKNIFVKETKWFCVIVDPFVLLHEINLSSTDKVSIDHNTHVKDINSCYY